MVVGNFAASHKPGNKGHIVLKSLTMFNNTKLYWILKSYKVIKK